MLSYGLTIILARNESQTAFAEFTYSVAWALILTQIIDVAATQCLTHFKISSKKNIEAILSSVYGAKIAALLLVLLVIAVTGSVTDFNVPMSTLYFLVPAFYLGPVFEMRSLNVLFAKIMFVEKAMILLFCYFYLSVYPFDVFIYVAYFIATAASLFVQFRLLNLNVPNPSKFNSAILARYFWQYWPIYLTLAPQIAYGHISRVIVEAKLGMLAFASVSLALQIVNALAIVQNQVDRHLRPRIAESVETSNIHALNALSLKYGVMYLLPLFGGCFLLYFFAGEIISFLFGEKWIVAADYLQYLLPLIITVAILRYLNIFVVALGAGRGNLIINLLAALALISALLSFPQDRPVKDYLVTIVIVQIVHVIVVTGYLLRKYPAKRIFMES